MKTILVAEDNENDIFFIGRAFRKAGIQCNLHVVQDGEAAMNYLSGSEPYGNRDDFPMPALILLDIKMPRRNGHEVLHWIRSRPELESIPVIMLTSSTEPGDIQQAYRFGANSYLVKPPGAEAFSELIQLVAKYWLAVNVCGV